MCAGVFCAADDVSIGGILLLTQLNEFNGIGQYFVAVANVRNEVNQFHVGHNENLQITIVTGDK